MQNFSVKLPYDFNEVELAYLGWGESDNENKIMCVHGLTRNAHDFDYLATRFAVEYNVICPDLPGRGDSKWLTNPKLYNYNTYLDVLYSLMILLELPAVNWIGTSLGGLIGMLMAVHYPDKIKKLVLNDIGPFIPLPSLMRIGKYVGLNPKFTNLAEAEKHLRLILAPFGIKHDKDWEYLTQYSFCLREDGFFYLNYDPAIARVFIDHSQIAINWWEIWAKIKCPVLVIRGAKSDILLPSTLAQMSAVKPDISIVQLEGVGHAPALLSEYEFDIINGWLNKDN